MSNTKTVMGQAANTQGIPLDITDVFSTYLYTGTGSAQTITNGIDLEGEGGMVWVKNRDTTDFHHLCDTERGSGKILFSNATNAQVTNNNTISGFSASGFSLGGDTAVSTNAEDYASWTFRKAPKFFDVQTFSTTYNVDPNVISHNLDGELGCAIFKQLNSTGQGYNWVVYHRSLGLNKYLRLNTSAASVSDTNSFEAVDNSAGTISFGYPMSDVASRLVSGGSETTDWVGYFFAHNDGDGEFGPDGSDIIKCGSYTGNGSSNGPEIDLGFEPQWLLTKRTDSGSSWQLVDVMRGMADAYQRIYPDTTAVEDYEGDGVIPTATGFKLTGVQSQHNASGGTYIYIAIRRGPLAPPKSATEVFAIDSESTTAPTPPSYNTGFAVDMFLSRRDVTTSGSWYLYDRLRKSDVGLIPNATNAELVSGGSYSTNDRNDGIGSYTGTVYSNKAYGYMWKRAPNFFDVLAYTGTGSLTPIGHNLGVAPELAIFKRRNDVQDWWVVQYPQDLSLRLNTTAAGTTADAATYGPVTATTMVPYLNTNGLNYIAYLFASLPGISKVGSYTGTGAAQDIDCGFTSGARFILLKKTSGTGNWYVFDSTRGIVAGNDPYLYLNLTNAEVTSRDGVDPLSSGFSLTTDSTFNASGASYIFYAIA